MAVHEKCKIICVIYLCSPCVHTACVYVMAGLYCILLHCDVAAVFSLQDHDNGVFGACEES